MQIKDLEAKNKKFIMLPAGYDPTNDLPFDYLEEAGKEKTMEDVVTDLKSCKMFIEFLTMVKNTFGLNLLQDNDIYWLEFRGKEIPGSRKKRFTTPGEIQDLIMIAGM